MTFLKSSIKNCNKICTQQKRRRRRADKLSSAAAAVPINKIRALVSGTKTSDGFDDRSRYMSVAVICWRRDLVYQIRWCAVVQTFLCTRMLSEYKTCARNNILKICCSSRLREERSLTQQQGVRVTIEDKFAGKLFVHALCMRSVCMKRICVKP